MCQRLIWDYEDALVNRDAAVTWILICKKELVYERGLLCWDVAKNICDYVFKGFQYADGEICFHSLRDGLSMVSPIAKFDAGRLIEWKFPLKDEKLKSKHIMHTVGILLNLCYDAENRFGVREGKWLIRSLPFTRSKRFQLMSFMRFVKSKEPIVLKGGEEEREFKCETVGEVLDFFKSLPKTEEDIPEARLLKGHCADNVWTVKHKMDFI